MHDDSVFSIAIFGSIDHKLRMQTFLDVTNAQPVNAKHSTRCTCLAASGSILVCAKRKRLACVVYAGRQGANGVDLNLNLNIIPELRTSRLSSPRLAACRSIRRCCHFGNTPVDFFCSHPFFVDAMVTVAV